MESDDDRFGPAAKSSRGGRTKKRRCYVYVQGGAYSHTLTPQKHAFYVVNILLNPQKGDKLHDKSVPDIETHPVPFLLVPLPTSNIPLSSIIIHGWTWTIGTIGSSTIEE